MVEIARVAKSVSKPHFVERVFSKEEIELCYSKKNPIESFSARFCVKEAFAKALGTGVRGFNLNEVSTLNDSLGCPYVVLSGNAKSLAQGLEVSVSITHTRDYASAVVILSPSSHTTP